MTRLAIAIAALVFMTGACFAQAPVITQPYGVTSVVSADHVVTTSTFKAALSANAARRGCTIQNLSANTMFVFVGAIANATTPSSISLASKGIFNCISGGNVMTDELSVTGTSGDQYVIIRQ